MNKWGIGSGQTESPDVPLALADCSQMLSHASPSVTHSLASWRPAQVCTLAIKLDTYNIMAFFPPVCSTFCILGTPPQYKVPIASNTDIGV